MRSFFSEIAAVLESPDPFRGQRVVCVPDFFLDHFVPMPEWDAAVHALKLVHDRGGGNLPVTPQALAPGGNAANTAHALARLGASTALVTRTSPLGARILADTLGRAGVDLTGVRDDGELAVTTILEFGPERRNVMLNHPAGVARFAFSDLRERDLTAIAGADAVHVANWTLNLAHGTDLSARVIRHAKLGGAATFFDPGDPTARLADVPDLRERVLSSPHLDVLAVNENELARYAPSGETMEARGRALQAAIRARLDVHTATRCLTWTPEGETAVPTFRISLARTTGAGDAWNAGNIAGHLLELPAQERLVLANAVAALALRSPDGRPPTREEVASFLRTEPPLTGR